MVKASFLRSASEYRWWLMRFLGREPLSTMCDVKNRYKNSKIRYFASVVNYNITKMDRNVILFTVRNMFPDLKLRHTFLGWRLLTNEYMRKYVEYY